MELDGFGQMVAVRVTHHFILWKFTEDVSSMFAHFDLWPCFCYVRVVCVMKLKEKSRSDRCPWCLYKSMVLTSAIPEMREGEDECRT